MSNTTPHSVLAFALRWTFFGADREFIPHDNVYINWREREQPQLGPHSTKDVAAFDARETAGVWLSAAGAVVTLDSALFDDGSLAGLDIAEFGKMIESKWRAGRDILGALIRKNNELAEAEVVSWVKDTQVQALQGALDQDEYYNNYARMYLIEVSGIASRQGLPAAVREAGRYLASATPSIKRLRSPVE